ncbi:MAG: hypothetical protein B6A08_14990 [Sorangiineae bacterium NIC37A_2]|mgnify:CR=1 FL=1|nr:MAG: hypothetical protein B6A08_14990 [Sorangiineae bacterium NIC37A_2]
MARSAPTSPTQSSQLGLQIALGALLGLLYTIVDAYLDRQLGIAGSSPASLIEVIHTVIDFVLPTLTGALLAVAAHMSRLKARMAELEKERVEDLRSQLRKIERDQAVWVVAASLLHELKNPLHALGLLLDEVSELGEGQTEERKRLLDRAQAQSERISRELSLLRSLPSAHNPNLPLAELSDVFAATLRARESLASAQGISLSVSKNPPPALASPEYLRIILDNLLDNAFEALRDTRGGSITLDAEQSGEKVRIRLEDSGPGVSEEVAEHLFEPLWSSKPHGLGLGLATARALARSMGGDLVYRRGPCVSYFELELRGAP